MPDPLMGTSKAQQQIDGIQQDSKEKNVQEKAKKMGYPYVNLLRFSVNSDLEHFIPKQKSINLKKLLFNLYF